MSNVSRQTHPVRQSRGDAISLYLTALHDFYPASKGKTRVALRADNRVIVTTPIPARARERMRLFDHMAELGTKLLLETDQYIILSTR